MAFWFDKGVDGFRVDMASSLIKNDPDKKEVSKLWNEMRAWKDKYYPETVHPPSGCQDSERRLRNS